MIHAVIFDYGSVLARTLDPEPRAVWERRLGLAAGELQRIVHNDGSWIEAQYGRATVTAYWQDVGTTLGLTPDETVALRADFYLGDVRNDELMTYIDRLRTAGLCLGLLSNFSMELRELLCQQDLLSHFDHLAISAEIGVMKPATSAYQAILDMVAVTASACIFVDDQPTNVDAAQRLGFHGILFQDNRSCLAALDRLLRIWL